MIDQDPRAPQPHALVQVLHTCPRFALRRIVGHLVEVDSKMYKPDCDEERSLLHRYTGPRVD
jgi:hypothetical protein